MAIYQYTAVRPGNKNKIMGTINADTERQARELLREQELYPTSVKLLRVNKMAEKTTKASASQSSLKNYIAENLSKVGMQEKIAFTQNLEMMVKAGIPITECLLYMESYMDNPSFKRLVNRIRLDILSGATFSKALARHKDVFNDVFISIVQAGEASGELETVLQRLASMLIAEAKLKKKIISALVYPVMVIVIAVLVLAVMFVFVLPTFAEMYAKMGIKLPMITQIMVGISDFLRNFWYITLAVLIGGGIGLKKFITSPTGKLVQDKLLLKIPVVAPLATAIACSHFISTLHVSFSAGLPITDCIFMACQTVTNSFIRNSFDEVNLKIQAGQRLASALADAEILPAMVVIMVSTGEESGSLDEMLKHSLVHIEGEVNQKVDILMSMMEPLLLILLGGVTGVMALAIYLPLFGMYEKIH